MKVLMFGWEFPPNNKGGLGTACYGLTKALSNSVEIIFVLPKDNSSHPHLNLIITDDLHIGNNKLKMQYINSLLSGYTTSSEYDINYNNLEKGNPGTCELYGRNLFEEVHRYAEKAKIIAKFENFDIIHCHDWMTYQAGINAKKESGKPLVVHVHATTYDRTGGRHDPQVYDIEKKGMEAADKIIAVSNYTKGIIKDHYGIPDEKIEVVHNGIEFNKNKEVFSTNEKIVLFLGRLTLQKGPEYFMESAKKVLEIMPDVKFVVAGTGDKYREMIHKSVDMGIGKNVLFTGHLKGNDIDKAYQMADLYVMPSVSEPFGITPLEALKNNTPVLISKTSGVSEVITNALKIDFWDINEMTNKIVSVLSYNNLKENLVNNGVRDAKQVTWDKVAHKTHQIYSNVIGGTT